MNTQQSKPVARKTHSRIETREAGCAEPIGYDWAVVWRGNHPLAAFLNRKMAEDFGAEIRYVGKPQWLALEDGEPNPAKKSDWHPCVLMIVRPNRRNNWPE